MGLHVFQPNQQQQQQQSLPNMSPTLRSPKMGRRVLQSRSPKQSRKLSQENDKSYTPPPPPLPTTFPPSTDPPNQKDHDEEESSVKSTPHLPPPPPPPPPPGIPSVNINSSPSKGLDRVLLERNLERLLVEQSGNIVSPELEKLINSQDRCREPLDLRQLNLSLDDWQPNTVQNNGIDTPDHVSSAPDLNALESNSARKPRDKGQLSVRFESEGGTCEDYARRNTRTKNYPNRSKRHGETSGVKGKKSMMTPPENTVPIDFSSRDDDDSYCSTCSSSSSDDDDVYELPPRRAYGGVRISYVPNDALAVARRHQANARSPTKLNSQPDKNCIIS